MRAKQLLEEMEAESQFCFSEGSFEGFKKRFHLSVRRTTNTSQKEPEDKRSVIQKFHSDIRRTANEGQKMGPLGQWTAHNIANMDQTPLPFSFSDGETYADTGQRSVWVQGGPSGLEKRQCAVQLTIFADGTPRVKPLLIFRGKGKHYIQIINFFSIPVLL